ncbi:hypothetical protein S245_023139 [Arachis hypogaea]
MFLLRKITIFVIRFLFLLVALQMLVYMGSPAKPLSSETDEIALLALKDKLTNSDPHALPSWNQSLHFCEWQGVTCSRRHMRVSSLQLQNQYWGGTLASSLGNLTFLREINLTNIYLHGEIPREIGRLKRLKILDLRNNNLGGHIPVEMINCSSLEVIILLYNNLTGKVPSWFGSMVQLTQLGLAANAGNQLVGNLLSNIPLAFPNLQNFACGGNLFTGILPFSISNLSELQKFDIEENGFYGPISPTLGSLHKLREFKVGRNRFGSGRAHDLDFLSSLTNCTQLQKLDFSENYLGGALTSLIGNLSTNLILFDMGLNQISGRIPETIGNLFGLASLLMDENALEGPIPNSIGKLKNLVIIFLSMNNLSGNIPTVIGNLTILSVVHMDFNAFKGSIPFTFRYCKKMHTFSVSVNNLSGNIPTQIFAYQKDLVNLDLSTNSFTGSIPEFGNLMHLSKLYMYANKFSGVIPVELGACSTLTELRLDRNFFHGNLPPFLGSLRSLERLDLSNNNFSSTIPHELENLTFLSNLNLSYNHLYGQVPLEGVFGNITVISLIGNNDLCGGIPQLNLPPCPEFSSNKHKSSHKKIIILISVIGGILISFMIFISIYCLRKKSEKLSFSPSLEHRYLKVSYGELHQATNGFSSSNLVGTGSSSSVYRGTLVHFERPVAVKVLNLQTCGASKSFIAECKVLGKIKHRNLLSLLTSCSSVDYKGNDFKAIVFEFMFNGSLETLLHNIVEDSESTNLSLNLMQRVNIALDVAFALDYLHNDSGEAIIHCDIKPSNVLLDDDIVAHLGDFGLARLVQGDRSSFTSNHGSSSIIKGTIGYVPPEYGAGGPVSPQGDIYSYGILLLEILTGKKPTDDMFGEDLSLHKFCKKAIPEGITEIVDSRLLTLFGKGERKIMQKQSTKECLVSFARIGVACSQEFPTRRMNIKDIIVELHAIKHKLLP